MKLSSEPIRLKCQCLEHPYCFLTGSWFTWSICHVIYTALWHRERCIAFLIKAELLSPKEREGYYIALTTHLSPMNFTQICFSPTNFLNGKSMNERDTTSFKDNISKCHVLSFLSPLPEFAMSAICSVLWN